MRIFDESYIKYGDVSDDNKQLFLQQEAQRVSVILQIDEFAVEITERVFDYTVRDHIIYINPDVDIKTALSFVLNVNRQYFCFIHDINPTVIDCTLFVASYCIYIHEMEAHDLMTEFPRNSKLSETVNAMVQGVWAGHIMFEPEGQIDGWLTVVRDTSRLFGKETTYGKN